MHRSNCRDLEVPEHRKLSIKSYKKSISDSSTVTRFLTSGKLLESGGVSGLTSKTCVNDAVRIWNIAPNKVTQADSINIANS